MLSRAAEHHSVAPPGAEVIQDVKETFLTGGGVQLDAWLRSKGNKITNSLRAAAAPSPGARRWRCFGGPGQTPDFGRPRRSPEGSMGLDPWALWGHLLGVAVAGGKERRKGTRRGQGQAAGRWCCTCNNKLRAQGLTAGLGPSWSYSPRGRPWWLGACKTPLGWPPSSKEPCGLRKARACPWTPQCPTYPPKSCPHKHCLVHYSFTLTTTPYQPTPA